VLIVSNNIPVKLGRRTSPESRRAKYGYIFAAPWLIGLMAFYFYPLFSSIFFSLTDYNGVIINGFVGFENYLKLFADNVFIISIRNTLFYAVLVVPISLIFGVSTALLLNLPTKAQGVYRVIAFLPTLVPGVATALIWQWLLMEIRKTKLLSFSKVVFYCKI